MTFFIAIVGRPNVGKSTIFNKLTNTSNSLVANIPNLTRDRKYGFIQWDKKNFCFIDTAGIKNNISNKMEKLIYCQAKIAIDKSDMVLLIVDFQSGLTENDKNIAKFLKKKKKKIVIILNKIEKSTFKRNINIWYSLGIEKIISISNIKKINTYVLLRRILSEIKNNISKFSYLKNTNTLNKKNTETISLKYSIKISIVGKQNVGKSTLFNCILGEERTIVFDKPGTTRDSISYAIKKNGFLYTIIDTAGIKKRINKLKQYEQLFIERTFQSIYSSDIILFVIDVNEKISNQDLTLVNFILRVGKPIVIAINKWDCISPKNKKIVKKEINLQLQSVSFIDVHFISAIYNTGINALFQSIHKSYQASSKRISTSKLNKIMQQAIQKHKQPNSCRSKIKYAHIGGYNPLTIVIHGKKVTNLPNSYKKYLKNFFYQSFKIIGIAIHLQFIDNNDYFRKNNK